MKTDIPVSKFIEATGETLYMTIIAFIVSVVLALIIGLFLYLSRKDGLFPKPKTYQVVSVIINFLRSTPFVILMLLLIPIIRFLIGKSIGTNAAVVALIVFGIPFIARLVENSFLEVDAGVIEAAQSLGVTTFELIWHFLLPEAASTLVNNLTIAAVSIVGSTAVAGTIGGGGLGDLAIQFGYNRYDYRTMFICVFIIIIIVQIIQTLGSILAKRAKHL